jgi:hypothetical protein
MRARRLCESVPPGLQVLLSEFGNPQPAPQSLGTDARHARSVLNASLGEQRRNCLLPLAPEL